MQTLGQPLGASHCWKKSTEGTAFISHLGAPNACAVLFEVHATDSRLIGLRLCRRT